PPQRVRTQARPPDHPLPFHRRPDFRRVRLIPGTRPPRLSPHLPRLRLPKRKPRKPGPGRHRPPPRRNRRNLERIEPGFDLQSDGSERIDLVAISAVSFLHVAPTSFGNTSGIRGEAAH